MNFMKYLKANNISLRELDFVFDIPYVTLYNKDYQKWLKN